MTIPIPEKHHIDRRAAQIVKGLPPMDDAQLLNTRQLAQLLCCSPEWLGYARSGGFGPPFKRLSNGQVRYSKGDVVKWLEERTYRHTAEYARKLEASQLDENGFYPNSHCEHPVERRTPTHCQHCGHAVRV